MTDGDTTRAQRAASRNWLHELLEEMVERAASDLFLKTGARPRLRLDGDVELLPEEGTVSPERMEQVGRLLTGERMDEFRTNGELDVAYESDPGRFRVNVFYQRGRISAAFRHVPRDIPGFEDLHLPAEQLQQLSLRTRGIVLVTGVTGSGKSTTLAAMIDYMNDHAKRHIVTIEDPIEFVHEDRSCLIEQREVGLDTTSFQRALKHVVRQSPDVILIGEMRDRETIETALNAAEIGHLVLSTLHTSSGAKTLERIVSYFPPHQHELIRTQISGTLQGIISQKLLPRAGEQGRVPAVELMMRTPTVCELILKGRTAELERAMEEDTYYGCQTYHDDLLRLCGEGAIDMDAALSASERPQEVKNRLRGLRTGRSTRSNRE